MSEYQDHHAYTLLSAVTLTASLNDNVRTFQAYGHRQADIEAFYTPAASSRTATVFVEYSSDGSNWVPYTSMYTDIDDGNTLILRDNPMTILGVTGGTTYGRKIHVPDLLTHIRLSAKESGAASFGTMTLKVTFN